MIEEMKRCPFCAEEILAIAKKCKHCGSGIEESVEPSEPTLSKPAADYGMCLLAIPAIATMLVWLWIANMNLLQSPSSKMALILVGTILGTAIVAAMEASKNGMKSDRKKGSYSATAWFFIITLLWIVGYPAYLFKRKHSGLASRLTAGIFIAFIFLGSWSIVDAAISEQVAAVQESFEQWE